MASKLVLSYKIDFDPNKGEKQKVAVINMITTARSLEKIQKSKRSVRVFQRETV